MNRYKTQLTILALGTKILKRIFYTDNILKRGFPHSVSMKSMHNKCEHIELLLTKYSTFEYDLYFRVTMLTQITLKLYYF